MKTVLFLGAGATRAQWEAEDKSVLQRTLDRYLRPKGDILAPPLDRDFFTWAGDRCRRDFPFVKAVFERELGVDVFLAHEREQVSIGMEWAFAELFNRASAEDSYLQVRLALHHLLVVYRKLIAVSTLPLFLGPASHTPLPQLFSALAERSDKLTVMTTNQDVAAEAMLDPKAGLVKWTKKGGKRLYDLYRLEIPYKLRDPQYRDTKRPPSFEMEGWPDVCILKLHGSLSWWYASDKKMDPVALTQVSELGLVLDKIIYPGDYLNTGEPDEQRLYPFVVPPIENKSEHCLGSVLNPVWEAAQEDELPHCERLVVLGYGFPRADKDARDLFALHLNRDVKEVSVIDVCETAAKRLIHLRDHVEGAVGDGHKVKYYESVDAYLAGVTKDFTDLKCPECDKPIPKAK